MNTTMHKIYLLIICLFTLPATAQRASTLEEGMKAYGDAKYAEAAEIFEQVIAQTPNPTDELFYNLGASYYKQGEYALALINFKRAYRIAPSDSDIRHNIKITRTKTIDNMEPSATFFVHRWIDSMTHWVGLGGWMFIGLLFFGVFVGGLLLYLLSRNRDLRLAGFYGGIAGVVLCILANVMVYRSYAFIHDDTEAVITSPVVTVKSSPDLSSQDMMIIHSGMEIRVLQSIGEISEVEFPDGTKGWVENSVYQLINDFIH